MLETLQSVAEKCDGVRCDMAMLVLKDVFEKTWAEVPTFEPRGGFRQKPGGRGPAVPEVPGARDGEFWQLAVPSIRKAHPEFLFLAEVYWGLEERLHSLGFDYTYDKELYDAVVHRDPLAVQERLTAVTPQFIGSAAHFLENHDEPRIASILSPAEHRAAALLILALPGMRFLHQGQLTGAQVKIPVQFARWKAEPTEPGVERLYREILSALPNTAVGRADGRVLMPRESSPDNLTQKSIVLVQWQADPKQFDLVAVNLAPHRSQCYAPLSVEGLAGQEWLMRDLLGTEEYRRSGRDLVDRGLYLDLPEHAAQIFHFSPA
jgi:hypothetical protein